MFYSVQKKSYGTIPRIYVQTGAPHKVRMSCFRQCHHASSQITLIFCHLLIILLQSVNYYYLQDYFLSFVSEKIHVDFVKFCEAPTY